MKGEYIMRENEYLKPNQKKHVLIRYKNQSRVSDILYIVSTGGYEIEINDEVVVTSQTSGYCFATAVTNPFELDKEMALGYGIGSKGQKYVRYDFDCLKGLEGCVICTCHDDEDLRDYNESVVAIINDRIGKINKEIAKIKSSQYQVEQKISELKYSLTDHLSELRSGKNYSKELKEILSELDEAEALHQRFQNKVRDLETKRSEYCS